MAPVDPRILTLLGHELRAPAGVVGGYLAMLERDATLTLQQRRAIDGARQAQQVIVEILDDVRRLAESATPSAGHAPAVALSAVAEALAMQASSAGLGITITPPVPMLSLEGPSDALATALFAVARAVTREHGADVTCRMAVDASNAGHVLVQMRPTGADEQAPLQRSSFHDLRTGLGLAILLAQARIERLGGTLHDLHREAERAGVEIRLPVHPRA